MTIHILTDKETNIFVMLMVMTIYVMSCKILSIILNFLMIIFSLVFDNLDVLFHLLVKLILLTTLFDILCCI